MSMSTESGLEIGFHRWESGRRRTLERTVSAAGKQAARERLTSRVRVWCLEVLSQAPRLLL